MTTTQSIPLNRLVQSKANVRRTGKTVAIEELMASIAAHGLRQNLNVKATSGGRYEVVAGGRRLIALKRLAKEGKLAADAPIDCLLLGDDDNAREISLVENTLRQAMHPDDQFEAFRNLVEGGSPVEDVAARFGVTPAVVRQRLKLAHVSPTLRALYRDGDMDLEQIMAFALVDDHTRQEEVWAELSEWNREPQSIRRALTRQSVPATDRLAKFVGLEAYIEAGGEVLRDLFDDSHGGYLTDAGLLQRLATAKLETAAGEVRAEGWAWVKPALEPDYSGSYGRIWPQAEADGEEPTFSVETMAGAGARLWIDYDGSIEIQRGLIDKETGQDEKTVRKGAGDGKTPSLPETVIEDLTAHRTAALRLELLRRPDMALAATVHAMALRLVFTNAYRADSVLDIRVDSEMLESHVQSLSECSAHAALAEARQRWAERLPGNPADLWDWCLAQDRDTLLDFLALMAAMSVNAVKEKADRADCPRLVHADRLAEAVSLDMAAHWTPTEDGFFSRLSKPLLAQALDEAGEPTIGAGVLGLKKAEAAHRTAQALAGKGWLPAPLRLRTAEVAEVQDGPEDVGPSRKEDMEAA